MIGKTDFVLKFSATNNAGMSSMVQEYTVKRVQTLGRRESSV